MSPIPLSVEKYDDLLSPSSPTPYQELRITKMLHMITKIASELRMRQGIAVPLIAMNLTWFAKISITTAFLGRLGELQLAGGALGVTFANVTGFSILSGLACAMEPICGQAHGAKNYKLLHKTLLMATLLLLVTTLPITCLWLNVDKILIHFGQRDDMVAIAKRYLLFLLPDLFITAFFYPLRGYLSAQGITRPILVTSTIATLSHLPITMMLSKSNGVEGVATAAWISDLIMTVLLMGNVLVLELEGGASWKLGGWREQGIKDWIVLLKLCGPCCLTTCLEWWCYEILILLTGHLPNAKEAVSILVIVLNFDYVLYSVMSSLAVCVSTRVSNQLGANRPKAASFSAYVALGTGTVAGCIGAVIVVAACGSWGKLFGRNKGVLRGVKKIMVLLAVLELANFPQNVCGGILRGTAKPWLGAYANIGGFYIVALPVGIVLGYKQKLGLEGLFYGFTAGVIVCMVLMLVFVAITDWEEGAAKAQVLASGEEDPPAGSASRSP